MEIKLKPLLAHQRKPLQDQLNLVLQTAACMKKWKKYAERSRDRFNRLTQLVVTEETYVRDLVMLKEKVKQQFVKAKIISLQQSNEIFPNLDGMIALSQQIHLALAEKLKSWNRKATLIGETMSKFSIAFIIYADFFKNLNESQQKLKKLVSTNEKAKSIQRSLSLPNRIITIDDLISKPFQRPLKYHLILRDYFSKTEPSHPDYVPLKKAIELYQGINQRNNNSIENKEKNQTLVNLESKFGNIITEARHYIAQYSAVCFQTPVVIYLFSNLAIFVLKKALDRELVRISFNKYSHIETVGDVLLFKNRLYFYGQKICVHLTFSDKLIRDDFYSCLKKLIEQINQNQTTRETIITNRVSRFSQASLKRKFSFTNLDPQLQRPIVAAIIGTEERINKNNQSTNYFVLQFYPQRLNFNTSFTPHHISFLSQDQLIKLQAFIYRLYPAELACISSSTIPRQILNDIQYYKNPQKKIEIKTVLIQLFLNSIFRSSIILKRIDIVMYFLKISDSIWNTLKISNSQVCMCRACLNSPNQYSKHEDYNRQILQREYNRVNQSTTKTKTQYCELRTIQSQQIYSQIRAQLMQTAKSQDKIAWCKSKLGWYNQTLANSHPSSRFLPKIKTKVYYRGFPIMIQFQINCQPSDTVRKIISTIGQRREMNFQDYVLVAQIGNTALILCDDEPIGSIFRQSNQQQGVFDKISHFFSKKEQLTINLYLQKYWVVFNPGDFFSPDKQRRLKVSSQTQSVMSRLSSSQLKMGEEETIELYALFLCKKYFSQFKNFDYQKIASKIRNRQQFYFPSKLQNESAISKLYQKIQKIKQNNQLRTDFDIGVLILQKVSEKPGWSCIMLDAVQQLPNDEIPVKIGCDLRCVRVRQQKKLAFYLEFRLQDDNWTHHTSGNSLIITESQKVFKFIGRQVWKIDQQIQFYKIYLASFGRN